MGYYPTPEEVTPIIARYLTRSGPGLIRILDPCAGEGTALRCIGDHLEAETYGIELDNERGARAKEILMQCLITDYHNTRISHNAFSMLWLNPPYDWACRDDYEQSERYERTFLRDCIQYLCPGGILVYLIPQPRLNKHIAQILSYRFEHIRVFRFPEEEYKVFKQLVIFGILKKDSSLDNPALEHLITCGQLTTEIPYLPQNPSALYEVPLSPSKVKLIFTSKEIDPEALSQEMLNYGLFPQLKELLTPLKLTEKIRPVMPLRYGHLAQILACGLMNDVVWDQNQLNPLLIKGVTKKETIHRVEVQGETEKHIETDQIKIVVHAINLDGEMLTIQ